ncbi:hypothetical protein FDECE_11170 [Fusarium decemcellulare]|nr:hypothetical protein FDECE_11170 [Fusarium decemcellulare]
MILYAGEVAMNPLLAWIIWTVPELDVDRRHSFQKEHDQAQALERPSSSAPAYCQLEDGEFRVLVLEPGARNEDLSCKLCICRHSDNVSYLALSYAWGDPAKVKQVQCNGQMIGIGSNLYQALIHLRNSHYERVFWVDALCINQDDFDERGHQVQDMRTVYANAREVFVWLGEADFHSRQIIGSFSSSKWDTFWQSANWNTIGFDHTIAAHQDFPTATDLDSLGVLLERPWFRRLWILQEVALAKRVTVMAGHGCISWETFASLIHRVHRSGASQKDFSASAQTSVNAVLEIETIRRSAQSSSTRDQRTLLSVLLATSSGECSDLRDKIFAVLALANDYNLDRDVDDFGPNYHLSPQEVFKKFAKWCISRGNLNVLSCTTRAEPELSGEFGELPSWVPNWANIYNDTPFIRYEDRLRFSAGLLVKEPILDAPRVTTDDTLILSGVTVDVVKEIAPLPSSPIHLGALRNLDSKLLLYKRWLCGHHGLDCLGGKDELPDQNLGESLWRTMTAGLNGEGFPATDNVGRWFYDYLQQVEQTEPQGQGLGPSHSTVSVLRDNIRQTRQTRRHNGVVMSALLMWSQKRRPAVTDRGTLALVPEGTQRGDVIVVVAGSKVPLVFRKLESGLSESYIVLGEGFVDDVMDGWFLKLLVENQAKLGGQPDGFALREYAVR